MSCNRQKIEYLGIEDEVDLCHYHLEMPKHSYHFLGFWIFWILLLTFLARYNPYSSIDVPWDNCDTNSTWEPPIRSYINKEQYKGELKKVATFREKNRLYRMNNFSRIDYGTTQLSYCKEDRKLNCNTITKTAVVRISTIGMQIKSILRTIELDPYVASGFRFLVLQTMSFKITLSIFRISDVLTSRRHPLPLFFRLIMSAFPYICGLESFSLFLITALHSEFDEAIGKWHPYAHICVGVFTFLELFLDLCLESVDKRYDLLNSPRFYTKLVGFLIFSLAYPQVVLNWLEFFKVKRCHAFVPLVDGLLEYLCALAIVIPPVLNSMMHVQMYITPAVGDIQHVSSFSKEEYCPVFQPKNIVIYESLSSDSKSES